MSNVFDIHDPELQNYQSPTEDEFQHIERSQLDYLRETVSMPQVVSLYTSIEKGGKVHCLWHNDKRTPNLHIYADGAYCFTCRKAFDMFDYVMKMEGCTFPDAVQFITDHLGSFPALETVAYASRRTSADYKGPVPRKWIDYWHRELTPDRRTWLYEARLLTDETIDRNLLGWRPDYKAYVVPFWDGVPRHSEVVTLQYRSTPESPPIAGPNWHYVGHAGHNRPFIVGSHLVNPDYMIGLIGTFDQLLAEQDGLPAFSPNGASVFGNPDRVESMDLRRRLAGTRRVVIVPDSTPSEHVHAQALAELLGGEVRYFPREMAGKDYTDFRRAGGTPREFVKMVLRDDKGFLYLLDAGQVTNCRLMLESVAQGDPESAYKIMQIVAEAARATFQDDDPSAIRARVSHTLQMLCLQAPHPTFTPKEWLLMGDDLYQVTDFRQLAGVLKRWGDKASAKLGGF